MAKRALAPVVETPQQPPPLPEKLLNARDVMKILGISRSELTVLVKKGLKCYKLGGGQRNLRFVEEELAVWLAEQQVSNSA